MGKKELFEEENESVEEENKSVEEGNKSKNSVKLISKKEFRELEKERPTRKNFNVLQCFEKKYPDDQKKYEVAKFIAMFEENMKPEDYHKCIMAPPTKDENGNKIKKTKVFLKKYFQDKFDHLLSVVSELSEKERNKLERKYKEAFEECKKDEQETEEKLKKWNAEHPEYNVYLENMKENKKRKKEEKEESGSSRKKSRKSSDEEHSSVFDNDTRSKSVSFMDIQTRFQQMDDAVYQLKKAIGNLIQ